MSEQTSVTPTPSLLHIELPIDAPMRGVIDTENDFLGVFGEVGREVTERSSEPVRWLLAHAATNGVIRLRLRGVPASKDVPASALPQIVRAVTTGLVAVEAESVRPNYFTDRALELSERIADRSAEIGSIRVVNGTVNTLLTQQGVATHVRELLGASYADWGAVEGRIEGVTVHDGREFSLYDALSGRRIRCHFGSRIPVKQVADALEQRAAVYGTINYRASGEIASVLADAIEVFRPDSDLATFDDVRGILG